MPHKRAKRSVREDQRSKIGADLAPAKQAISSESIPKSVSRILNAASIREQFREKKRKLEPGEDTGEQEEKAGKRRRVDSQTKITTKDGKGKPPGIQPGESLGHYNRRVENDMRPLVKSAMQTSSAQARKTKKSELEEKAQSKVSKTKHKSVTEAPERSPPPPAPATVVSKHTERLTEFQKNSTSAPRRLNDIAQAPPEFKRLPRGAKSGDKGREGVLGMKQKAMMDDEREKAIARYRVLKQQRRVEGGAGDEREEGNE